MPHNDRRGINALMSMNPIQRNFQAVMDEKGLNPRSWALKAGLKETRVKAVMQGKSKHPRADALKLLAQAADVPVERLVAGPVGVQAALDDPEEGANVAVRDGGPQGGEGLGPLDQSELSLIRFWRTLDRKEKQTATWLLGSVGYQR